MRNARSQRCGDIPCQSQPQAAPMAARGNALSPLWAPRTRLPSAEIGTPCCVDDYTRLKFARFLKRKSIAVTELRNLVVEHIAPAGLEIGTVRTDDGGEFDCQFQSLLNEMGVKRDSTSPYTPQCNGIVERVLGLLHGKTVALLRGMTAGKSERLWVEAM